MDTPASPKTTSFPHQAAKLSWVCPLILFVLMMFCRRIASPLIIDWVGLLLIVVGLACGIIALFNIPRHGTKGILMPAIIGLIINGLLLFIFITNFLAARPSR